jgi:hypothetical protein
MVRPATDTNDTITVQAVGVEISSIIVSCAATGSNNAVTVDGGNFCLLQNLWITGATNDGVSFSNTDHSIIRNACISNSANDGIRVNDNTTNLDIEDTCVFSNGRDGINIDGSGISTIKIRGKKLDVYNNARYGLNIGTTSEDTLIDGDCTIQENVLADINDQGIDTHYSGIDHSAAFRGAAVYIDIANGTSGTKYPRGTPGTPVNNIADARTIADELGLNTIRLRGSVTLDTNFDNFRFEGISNVSSDIVDLNGQGCSGASFVNLTLIGSAASLASYDASSCIINSSQLLLGSYRQCMFKGNCAFDTGNTVLNLCGSETTAGVSPVFGFSASGSNAEFNNFSGIATISGISEQAQTVVLSFTSGMTTIDNSCISGTIHIHGVVSVTDNSGPDCNVIRTSQLEAAPAAYEGRIWLDTTSTNSGTIYPVGTRWKPVNNITDARTLSNSLGIHLVHCDGAITLNNNFDNFVFECDTFANSTINLNNQSTSGAAFNNISLTGQCNGRIEAHCTFYGSSGDGCGFEC